MEEARVNEQIVPTVERLNEADHGDYLVRSAIEITALLRAIHESEIPLAAYLGPEREYLLCSMLDVNSEENSVVLGYGVDKQRSDELLKSDNVIFDCVYKNAKVQFSATKPAETVFQNVPAFKVPIPRLLWWLQRRTHPRFKIPSVEPVKLILNFAGVTQVEAGIVDISLGGIGAITYPADVNIKPGEILENCVLKFPQGDTAVINIKVLYSMTTTLRDGQRVKHSGCQFVALNKDLQALIHRYVIRLERIHY